MRDQDGVLVVAERPVVLQKVLQVRHQLQIGRELGPVSEQVCVVELQVDDVLEIRAVALELAALLSLGGRGGAGAGLRNAPGCHGGERERNRQRARDLQAFTHALLLLDDRGNLFPRVRKCES